MLYRLLSLGSLFTLLLFSVHCGGGDPATGGTETDGGSGGPDGGSNPDGGGSGPDGGDPAPEGASIETRLMSTEVGVSLAALTAGAATGAGLESLKYYIYSIEICEELETQGTGFSGAQGCLTLYQGNRDAYRYDPADPETMLQVAEDARTSDVGFIDLVDANSLASLSSTRALTLEDARSYHYGVIVWAPAIKVRATIDLPGGTSLFTRDGEVRSETFPDGFTAYYTEAASPMNEGPAEDVVVLTTNGGNWFKFQSPLVVTAEDIEAERSFVLDLVFNPDGIVKGYADDGSTGHVRETDPESGQILRGITVPMLDLSPVPHRASERVIRESYVGPVELGAHSFDLRVEVYSVENDPAETLFGIDVKTLVRESTTQVPPEASKVSFLRTEDDGSLTFLSWSDTPILTGFARAENEGDSVVVGLRCGQHGGNGGHGLVIVDSCPSEIVDVSLTLATRELVEAAAP